MSLLLLLMGDSGYNVRSELFGAGEVGAWYDPSDFSTMWQDAAGDTPVTAAGDVVGLILDKSRSGPSMGSNQATNGTFDKDEDWTKGTGWTIGSGVATKTAGSASLLSQAQTMTVGRYYIVTYTITRTAGSITPQFAGATTVSGTARSTSGTFTDIMTVVSGNNTLQFSADASFAGTVDNVSLKELSAGNHAYQTTSASRPTLQTSGGLWYLSFDGSDDSLVTNAVDFSGTDEMTVIAGVRKLSDAAAGMVLELSAIATNAGTFYIAAPDTVAQHNYQFFLQTVGGGISYRPSPYVAPISNVLSVVYDRSGASISQQISPRINGGLSQITATGSDTATGNFGNYQLFICRRNQATVPYNGHLYQLIVRGKTTPTGKLLEAERFTARKTGLSI